MSATVESLETGMLRRPDGAEIYWETAGNPRGRPAVYLHGGPGSGLRSVSYRQSFDPERYLVVGLDQRGCGRSRPLATDDLAGLDANTTQAVIADLEALREHLGIASWQVVGGSWGATLALAYALAHRDRVSGVVLAAVTTGSREEIDWLTVGMGRIFPEAWQEFASVLGPGERTVAGYARLLRDPDPAVRRAAADRWDDWESTHVSLDPRWRPGPMVEDPREREVFATLVTHYWAHDCFLTGSDRILDRAGELEGVPGVLIHGRRDVSGPVITAWRLHHAWPGSRLEVVESEGHGGARMSELVREATDGFAR